MKQKYPREFFNCNHMHLVLQAEQLDVPAEFVEPIMFSLKRLEFKLACLITWHMKGLLKDKTTEQVIALLSWEEEDQNEKQ
jgi:hypothetical protein